MRTAGIEVGNLKLARLLANSKLLTIAPRAAVTTGTNDSTGTIRHADRRKVYPTPPLNGRESSGGHSGVRHRREEKYAVGSGNAGRKES